MKIHIIIVLLILSLSCTEKSHKDNTQMCPPCIPGFILIVNLGEANNSIIPLVSNTNKDDSTYYYRYISDGVDKHDLEKLDKYGFLITDFPFGKSVTNVFIDAQTYCSIKKYIIQNDTKKNLNYWNSDNNSIRIILSDQCDSITYGIRKDDLRYFENLLDSINKFDNKDLEREITEYKNVHEFDYKK